MTGFRACVLLLALAGIAFAVVWFRAEQTCVAAHTLSLESRWVQLRRELWVAQTGVARLRTPHAIRDRVDRVDLFEIELVPPGGPAWKRVKQRVEGPAPGETFVVSGQH